MLFPSPNESHVQCTECATDSNAQSDPLRHWGNVFDPACAIRIRYVSIEVSKPDEQKARSYPNNREERHRFHYLK